MAKSDLTMRMKKNNMRLVCGECAKNGLDLRFQSCAVLIDHLFADHPLSRISSAIEQFMKEYSERVEEKYALQPQRALFMDYS